MMKDGPGKFYENTISLLETTLVKIKIHTLNCYYQSICKNAKLEMQIREFIV